MGTTFDRVVLSAKILPGTTTPFVFNKYMPSELDPAQMLVQYVEVNSNNALQNVIRTLQLMSGLTPIPPFEVPTDDINSDGKIGIAEAIDFLKQSEL